MVPFWFPSSLCGLILLLCGCNVGSKWRGHEHLAKETFPHVNEAPNIKPDKQKAMGARLLKTYKKERALLERQRTSSIEEERTGADEE